MKSLEELMKLRDASKQKIDMRNNSEKKYRIVVGMATCGIAAGARPVLNALVEETAKADYNCIVTQTGCIGMCSLEPIMEVFDDHGNKTTYVHMNAEKAVEVLKEHIGNGNVVEKYTVAATDQVRR